MSDRSGIMLASFVLGALSGAVAALLLAPQSGAETRVMIKDKSIELRDKAQQSAEQARARTDEVVRQIKEQGQTAMASMRGNGAPKAEGEATAV